MRRSSSRPWTGPTARYQARDSAPSRAVLVGRPYRETWTGATELRTLAAHVEALGGRLEIIADLGDQRLAFTEPGNEAA